jgi:diadenosine tetraphosphatase ApaH/serine/threonine PP2A family protein phosphatase
MTALVISDVHANLEALEAVLADVAGQGYDELWFLGDIVGYGPDPNACVERVRGLSPSVWLAGNHDWAALGKLNLDAFNPEARLAAEWTGAELTAENRAFLDSLLPQGEDAARHLDFVHGSPRHPLWEYILDAGVAAASFEAFDGPLCFFGHTHIPVAYAEGVDGVERVRPQGGMALALDQAARWLLNPGSVGQPRDGDPRAAYGLMDLRARTFQLQRVEYDVEAVQAKILAAGLPPRLAARLKFGW